MQAAANQIGVDWWNTVDGCTDAIQPVDAGLGREVRREIGKISGEWLDTGDNVDRWEGVNGTLSAGDRRILMAQWAAQAWNRVTQNDTMLRRMFERTGCHLAKHPGSLDKLVKLEQLTAEQVAEYQQDLKIPYNKADYKVQALGLSNGSLTAL